MLLLLDIMVETFRRHLSCYIRGRCLLVGRLSARE